MPKVTFLPVNRVVDGNPGDSILEIALMHDIPLQHACGGFCACTTCHVEVREGLQSLSAIEEEENERMEALDLPTSSSRLGCQARLGSQDVTVEIQNLDE